MSKNPYRIIKKQLVASIHSIFFFQYQYKNFLHHNFAAISTQLCSWTDIPSELLSVIISRPMFFDVLRHHFYHHIYNYLSHLSILHIMNAFGVLKNNHKHKHWRKGVLAIWATVALVGRVPMVLMFNFPFYGWIDHSQGYNIVVLMRNPWMREPIRSL